MITKERLEELIEQKAIIYSVCYGEVFEEKLTSNHFVGVADDEISLMQRYNGYEKDLVDYIRCLYETEEEANWVAEFGDIVKTDKLDLERWEKLKDCIYDNVFVVFDGELGEYVEYFMLVDKDIKILFRTLEHNMSTVYDIIFQEERTKENYTIACRKAKELFLGEKK